MNDRADGGSRVTFPQSGQKKLLQQRQFHDFDALKESIAGWELDWRQLDKGPLESELLQVGVGAALLTHVTFSRQFDQRGSSPPGTRTFALVEEQVQGTRWCRREFDDSNVSTFHPGGDYESVSLPGFTAYTLSFPEEHLVVVGETLGIQDVDRLLGGADWVATCDRGAMNGLRRSLRLLCKEVTHRPSVLESSGLVRELEVEIPARILKALASSRGERDERVLSHGRQRAVDRARSFIGQNPSMPITVEELSRAAGVSWRTLDYAFRGQFGVSPKSYLQAIRLNGARRELIEAAPDEKVADVANKWGFWHMGQFASDYRKMFGELPSETLSRGLSTSR